MSADQYYIVRCGARAWILVEKTRVAERARQRYPCAWGTVDSGWRLRKAPSGAIPSTPTAALCAPRVAGAAPELPSVAEAAAFSVVVHGPEPDRVALAVSAAGKGWLPVLAAQPWEMRGALLRLLAESGALELKAPPRVHRLLVSLRWLSTPETWRERAGWALRGLAAGADSVWLAACLRWHLRHGKDLPEVSSAGRVRPSARMLRLLMLHSCDCLQNEAAAVWDLLSRDQDGGLAAAALRSLGPPTRIPEWGQELFCLFQKLDPQIPDCRWRRALFLRLMPELMRVARIMNPKNQEPCADLVENWICKSPAAWPGMAEDLLFWLRSVAVMPASPLLDDGSWFLVCCCAALDPAGRALLRTWTPEDLRRFGRMSAGWGFRSEITEALIPGAMPLKFLAQALHSHLRSMQEILTALSQAPPEGIRRVWRAMEEHPLVSCDPEAMSLGEALFLLDSVSEGRGGEAPDLPGSVRRLIEGHPDRPLAPGGARLLMMRGNAGKGQEKRRGPGAEQTTAVLAPPAPPAVSGARLQEARWALLRLWWRRAVEAFRVLVDGELRRGFPGLRHDRNLNLHTLCMAMRNHESSDNASASRALVRAADRGCADRTWALELPLNRRWLERHPEASHPAWREGCAVSVKLEKEGEITLSLEEDLQEILQMGTRFGTCLSLGGCYGHSPVAVALDANKRLLLARNASGKIIARQLLALSDCRGLVCFAVYTHREEAELRAAFGTYNLMLAQALRVPVWRGGGDYQIDRIVCREWYDDGAWRFWKEHAGLET